jgi:NADH dehydrogenase
MRWLLVEAGKRIMQEVPESLSEFAERELRGRGIEVSHGHDPARGRASHATLSRMARSIPGAHRRVDGRGQAEPGRRKARAAAGSRRAGGCRSDDARGRPPTDAQAAAGGAGAVWAIGDCAAVPDAYAQGRPCPPTAQHAIRQGRLVARNVAATLAGGRARPFRYRTKGVVAELGHNQAVAITLGIRWRGLPRG